MNLTTMMDHLLLLGTSGALDGLLLRSGGFYQNDFTKPLLFLIRGCAAVQGGTVEPAWFTVGHDERDGQLPWAGVAVALYLLVPDPSLQYLTECGCLGVADDGGPSALLVFFPYLPYLNRLPYYLDVHRLIWREYYHDVHAKRHYPVGSSPPAT